MNRNRLKHIFHPYLVVLVLSICLIYSITEIVSLNDKLHLRNTENWFNDTLDLDANQEIDFAYTAPYAGYLTINHNTLPTNVRINVGYNYNGSYHSFETNGYASIPVLPTEITIRVCNVNENGATGSLNLTYVY
jgi:hypothetical protein